MGWASRYIQKLRAGDLRAIGMVARFLSCDVRGDRLAGLRANR
jgi:hypothetical protein